MKTVFKKKATERSSTPAFSVQRQRGEFHGCSYRGRQANFVATSTSLGERFRKKKRLYLWVIFDWHVPDFKNPFLCIMMWSPLYPGKSRDSSPVHGENSSPIQGRNAPQNNYSVVLLLPTEPFWNAVILQRPRPATHRTDSYHFWLQKVPTSSSLQNDPTTCLEELLYLRFYSIILVALGSHVALGKLLIEVPNPSNVLMMPSVLLTTSTSISSGPELSLTAFALNAALAGDELWAVGEKGALPRTIPCAERFEFSGKFKAYTSFIGAVEYAEFLASVPVE